MDTEQFVVYPNPFENEILLPSGNHSGSKYKLFNMQGILLVEGDLEQINQTIIQLSTGVFLFQSDKGQCIKLIKQNY
jgi:hypothetical protein